MKIFYSLCIILTFISCANSKSQFTKSEEVIIKPITLKKNMEVIPESESLIVGLVPQAIDFGIKQITKIIEKESKKYTSEYTASLIDDQFYLNDKTRILNTIGFELIRKAKHKKSKGKSEITSQMKFSIELSKDKSFFRFAPSEIQILKTKAKLKENDNDVDILINIKVFGYWVNQKQDYKSELLSESNFDLKKICLENKYENKGRFLTSVSDTVFVNKSDWVPLIPLSIDKKGESLPDAQGNYKIYVTVTEVDEFGERVKKISEVLENNQDKIIEELQNLLDNN